MANRTHTKTVHKPHAAQRIAFSRAPGEEKHDKWHKLSRKIGPILNAPPGASVATRCWVAFNGSGHKAEFWDKQA